MTILDASGNFQKSLYSIPTIPTILFCMASKEILIQYVEQKKEVLGINKVFSKTRLFTNFWTLIMANVEHGR